MKKKIIILPLLSMLFTTACGQKPKVVLDSIGLSGEYKTLFNLNEEFTYEGLIVTAYYSNNTSKVVDDYHIEIPDMSVGGSQRVDISYTEKDRTATNYYSIFIDEPVIEYDDIEINIGQAIVTSETVSQTIIADQHPESIGRVSMVLKVNFNGNTSSKQYYGISFTAGKNNISGDSGVGYKANFSDGTGQYNLIQLEIAKDKRLEVSNQIDFKLTYAAAGLTFEVVSFKLHYTTWKPTDVENVDINEYLWKDSSGKDGDGNAYQIDIPYSSFEKKGKVNKAIISFETSNLETWAQANIYVTGFAFTGFNDCRNNLVDLGPQMSKDGSGAKTSGSVTLYPLFPIDLKTSGSISLSCWYSSGVYVLIKSITMVTDSLVAPNPVTNLVAHAIDKAVVLSWDPVESASSYEIYVNDTKVNEVTDSYVTINNLTNGTSYKFGVAAKNVVGTSTITSINATPSDEGDYDQFIDGLNTPLETSLGVGKIQTLFNNCSRNTENSSNARLKDKIEKIQNGEQSTIAYIGGSITVGEGATDYDENHRFKGYAYHSYQWIKSTYATNNNTRFVNGSICGTGSHIGIVRLGKDILDYSPDIVFIEFAANNGRATIDKDTYESMVRECLSLPNNPAVILVFSATYYSDGTNGAEAYMVQIGSHYSLPMFSMDKALKSISDNGKLEKGKGILGQYSADGTHPNSQGHQLCGKALAYFLKGQINKTKQSEVAIPSSDSGVGRSKYINMTRVDHDSNKGCITSLGSWKEANTSTHSVAEQSDTSAFRQGWKKTSTTENEPLTIDVKAKNMIIIYQAGNPSVSKADEPKGNMIVTYVNKHDSNDTYTLTWDVTKTCTQPVDNSLQIKEGGNGWDNPCGILVLDKDIADDYIITIKMSSNTEIGSLMAFGYTK